MLWLPTQVRQPEDAIMDILENAIKTELPDYTLGKLISDLVGSERAHDANLGTASRVEAKDGHNLVSTWWKIQADVLLFQPDPTRHPGIDRIQALCDQWGTGLTAENVQKLRGKVCIKLGVSLAEANEMTLDAVATTLGAVGGKGGAKETPARTVMPSAATENSTQTGQPLSDDAVDAEISEEATRRRGGRSSIVSNDESTLEILEQIDSGLYGRVFRARQVDLDRVVAVKIIKPEHSHRADAVAHAKALARVGVHPNIVTVYSVQPVKVESTEMPAMVMEWLEGQTFAKRLGGERFSEHEVRRICMGVLDGIERMHEAGIQHGDLHFGNIILLSDSHPKIIDVDATQNRSLGRLSDVSREGAIGADVDYCRQLVHRTFGHSVLGPSLVNKLEADLGTVTSLADVRSLVDQALEQQESYGSGVATANPPLQAAETLWASAQEFIESNRPASLHGLIMGHAKLLRDELLGDRFPVSGTDVNAEVVRKRIAQYEECVSPLMPGLAAGCFWGEQQHWNLWKQCIETAANCYEELGYQSRSGFRTLLELRQYPALLLFYACGLGAFLNGRYGTIRSLMRNLDYVYEKERRNLAQEFIYWKQEQVPSWNTSAVDGASNRHTPVSDHVCSIIYPALSHLSLLRSTFDMQFDRFEYFVGLAYFGDHVDRSDDFTFPEGTYLWRRANDRLFGTEFVTEAREQGDDWPPFKAGIFHVSNSEFEDLVKQFNARIDSLRAQLHIRVFGR
jgi:Protein kinase domain